MKQAIEIKLMGPSSFRYVDCPECGKTNILQNQKSGTLVDKVFCFCGCVFQLVTVLNVLVPKCDELCSTCPNICIKAED